MASLPDEVSHANRQRPQERPARDTQPWTTTRCHRLLRPLKTHIFALRREDEQESSESMNDDVSEDGKSGTAVGPISSTGRYQHTYSRRGRKPSAAATSSASQPQGSQHPQTSYSTRLPRQKILQPGEIVLPTPVIRRARHQDVSPMQQPALPIHEPKRGRGRPRCTTWVPPGGHVILKPPSMVSAFENQMLPLRYRISTSRFLLYESILRALHALLVATTSPAPTTAQSGTQSTSATGNSKSLMAMCLRKIPEYIGELEYWEQRDAEEMGTRSTLQDSEVSNQIYETVEDMLPSGRGCPQLRSIVRAHGMRVVRDAMAEGLLDDHFSLLLVALCHRTKAYLEAEGLLEVILDRSYPRPKGVDSTFDDGRSLAPLKSLRDFARDSDRPQFMLKQLSKLMKTRQLPLDWLSTKEFASIWSSIVKTLAGDSVCDTTVSCAIHMIILLSSQARSQTFTLRPEKGDLKCLSQQTLISAISALTSICLLRQDAKVGPIHHTARKAASTTSVRITYIIEACRYQMKRARKSGWMSTVLDLSAHFLDTSQTGSTANVPEVWHRVLQECNKRNGKQNHEATMTLLSSMARSCGQGAAEPAYFHLIKFCDQLDTMANVEAGMSRQLRTDCAFHLAERTNDMRDLAYAESFADSMATTGSSTANKTPRELSSTFTTTKFRWDADISEWVTATPAPPRPSRRLSTRSEELRRGSVAETCADETDSDSGVSGVEASAKLHGPYKKPPRRWTRSSATRTNRHTQPQGSAIAPSTRKRNFSVAGLLSLQPSKDGVKQEEDDDDDDDSNGGISRSRSKHQGPRSGQRSGQENSVSLVSGVDAKKRRRVGDEAILKPRRAILRTITNTSPADLSDDELGL